MQLSADQLRDFEEQGYLFFPNCFSEEEIALLRDDAEAILKLDRQEVWREKTGAPRTAFAARYATVATVCRSNAISASIIHSVPVVPLCFFVIPSDFSRSEK